MTVTVGIHAVFTVVQSNGSRTLPVARGALEQHCSQVMDELLKLEASGCGIDSPAVSVDLGAGTVEIELRAQGATFEDAQECGQSSM